LTGAKMAAFIKSNDHITIVFDNGESTTVYTSNPKYKEIVAALNDKNYVLVRKLAVPAIAVKANMQKIARTSSSLVEVKNGVVYYNGAPLHNALTQRIIDMSVDGFDIQPMINFLINLKQNPSFRAVNELYTFLEKGNLPITEDGHFLAYKKVNENYLDCHTNTINNKVGEIVEMERNLVDEDASRTCSAGLHFCSKEYLASFSGSHTMIVKINPRDVVAIPIDYNNAKGRTCRYEVVGEINADENLEGSYRPTPGYVEPATYEPEDIYDDELDDVNDDDYCDYCGEVDCDYLYDVHPEDEDDEYVEHIDEDYPEENNITAGVPAMVETLDGQLVEAPVAGTQAVLPDEQVQSIDPTDGAVIATYASIEAAAKEYGVTPSMIRRVIKGDSKTTGGVSWATVRPTLTVLAPTVDPTAPHAGNLAKMHEHGTLKNGQPHIKYEYIDDEDLEDEDDDDNYYDWNR